ncbi:hypothetical protein C8J56DRAFT_739915, partial [Mycena floridula]
LSTLRSLPPAKDVDVKDISGNLPDEEKQLAVNVFKYFVCSCSNDVNSYGVGIGRRLKVVEMNVLGSGRPSGRPETVQGQTVCEILVESDMCNIFGTLHGACAAYLVDPCSVSSLVVLGVAVGINGTGVSQSMNLIWHQPATRGTKLRIVATSVFIDGRIRTSRCEIWNETQDQLFVSAVHSTV